FEMQRLRSATRAEALVASLSTVDAAHLPDVIDGLQPLRQWADPLLRRLAADSMAERQVRLRTSLALLPVELGQAESLVDQPDDASIDELLAIHRTLAESGTGLAPRLWDGLQDATQTSAVNRVRRAGLLAAFDPEGPNWANLGPEVSAFLVSENPLNL